ncbi:MAG: prepilin-type N-terminal cleavage/methylation domain-containing protein [Armatimonadetes bacterium]|nr:prepilin-type N-terminal cleavage/methylation domain-containing protein [Armatimonadota bacterium]
MKRTRSSAFTLIELLVVIAIIAILAAILFPVFAQAKTAAKKAMATSNMKQMLLAVNIYATDFDDTASPRYRLGCGPRINGADVSDGMSWEVLAYPYAKNLGVFESSMDTRAKYNTPFGQFRRAFGGAPNFFRGYQGCGSYFKANAYSTPSMTYFPQPSDTVVLGEERMLSNSRSDYFTSIDWAASTTNPKFPNAVFENTRNINLGGTGNGSCTPNKICKAWCFINNDYAEASVWGMADGHVVTKKGTGKTRDGYNNGTEFKGYEHRAATWDKDGEQYPDWTAGMSCMDWDLEPPGTNGGTRGCIVPGENVNAGS